jgi:hypothetical protein
MVNECAATFHPARHGGGTGSKEGSMSQVLTTAEIYAQFPSEWALLDNPQTDKQLAILGGTVLWHSKDRDEVYRKAIEVPAPKNIAILYTGPVATPGTAIML